jgi:predicted Zn-ribbon and HTH transcriptional regulator
MSPTRRQSVAEILRSGPVTVLNLARRIGAPVKSILEDMEHIRKSSKGKNRLVIRQPECSACGFGFRDRSS